MYIRFRERGFSSKKLQGLICHKTHLTNSLILYYIIRLYFSIVKSNFCFVFIVRDLSEDEEFVDELRTNIRFIAAVLLRRAKKVSILQSLKVQFIGNRFPK